METLIDYFTKDFLQSALENALAIILIIAVGRFFSTLVVALIKRISKKASPKLAERKARTLSSIAESFARYSIDFLIVYSVLIRLGFSQNSILAIVSVFGVAVGLGAQNFVKDIINGFFILLEDQYGVGDYIEIGAKTGVVENIGLRTTSVRNSDGALHIIPNSEIRVVSNFAHKFSRIIITIPISADQNTDKVVGVLREELLAAFKERDDLLTEPVVYNSERVAGKTIPVKVLTDCSLGAKEAEENYLRERINFRFVKEQIEIIPQKTR
jgi:small conductance mechanosensitive channel